MLVDALFYIFVNINTLFYLDIPNIPPTVSTEDDESKSQQKAPCRTTGGRIYQDGDHYASNDTGIRRNREDQCVMCICEVCIYRIA